MGNIAYLFSVLTGVVCFVQAQTFQIRKEFINGNLKLTWTNFSTHLNFNDITVTKDGLVRLWEQMDGTKNAWKRIVDDQYTVEDVWNYNSVNITIREYTESSVFSDYKLNYNVLRVDSQEGETKNLSWMEAFFPRSWEYNIFHFYDSSNKTVIQVRGDGATSINAEKYVYHSRPFNSTNVVFEVKNITLMDAGYYGGGTTQINARRGQGVILVVRGKPTKPEIAGILKVNETSDVILTCSSNSTSRPSYYRKTVSLRYIWYRNHTVMHLETGMTLRLPRISRDVRFNKYSCQAKESIVSEKSDAIKINILYGPSSVTINPKLPVNKTVSVKDGNYIGPYHCSADCNPPCIIKWEYKLSSGTFRDATSDGGTLVQQRVFKDKVLFRCVARSTFYKSLRTPIKLYIMYLSEPSLNVNGKQKFVDIREREPLTLSCVVDGRPTPSITISRYQQMEVMESKITNALNVSIPEVQCSDADIYSCTGSSEGFVSNHKEVTVGVLCKTRIDVKPWFKANYGTKSENGVKVIVNAPIISYPKPSPNLISWSGPTSADIQNEIKERGDVIYNHWITSTIPVNDQTYFGKYTLSYDGEVIYTITIDDEGIPKPPLNFTAYSYTSGYINLTWTSDFNGGPEQFFILSRKDGAVWIEVVNITDPGEGDMGYYDPGLLNPGREYWYRLESCNRIGCSVRAVEVKVTVLDCEKGYYLDVKNPKGHYRNNSDCWPCGNCRDSLPCNTTTGQCSDGCKTNYKPPYCTEVITSDNASTIQPTTVVIMALSTVLVVAIATIVGMAFRQRSKRRLEYKRSQRKNERDTTMNAAQQRLEGDGGPEFPLAEYDKIDTTIDEHIYDQFGLSTEDYYQNIRAGSNRVPAP
ncbi:uncharacterized protein LOC125661400 [Ostrea edulis]|uniref:uncharacterized protein LOC125661400 n=1 Tax=Ostrea edulis TaxID=37623 RepID=UPI0024AFEE66|nr:uncharacterized protein LOC125661400 [Ostrea edulis]